MKRYPLLLQLLFYVLLGFFGLLGLVGAVYYQTSSSAIRQTTEQQTRETIQQSSQFVTAYIQRLKETTNTLAQHEEVKSYALSPTGQKEEQVKGLFDTILSTDRDLVEAVFVTKNGQVIATDDSLSMQTSSDMMAEPWYQRAIDQGAMPVLTPARMGEGASMDDWVISITQEVVASDGTNLGVLRLDCDYQTLATYLDHLHLGEQGFTFIVNSQHEFVYHPRQTVYSSSEEMAAMQAYLDVPDGYVADHSAFVYQTEVADSHWTLIGVASLDGLAALQKRLLLTFLGTGLIALVIFGVGAWFILCWWIKPIRDFRQVILEVGAGRQDLRANEAGSPELVDLSRQFNAMLDQIDQLMLSIKDKEQAIRTYELQALASQINPHFLYNTLDTIIWMAEFNEREKVVDLTKSLATYFRLALNKGNEQIRLSDELEHVKQYLFIQQQRYGDKLSYTIQDLPAYGDYLLPKLVLQPLVENAIYHGIKEVRRKGKIRVEVTEDREFLYLQVTDNGQGFSSDRPKAELALGGVGLKNVDDRLRLQFGTAYQMTIDSEPDRYTRICLRLPK